jgi:N utilization substance protein B
MRRRELREHIFKLLFMTQFNSEEEMLQQLANYFDGLVDLEEKDQTYMQEKYTRVASHLGEIDGILNEYSAGWRTDRMSRVDLTALRLAVYEMKYESEDVPVGVAINEAVELAKCFGGDTSGSFVNGVLGKIASGRKDSGAPKKPQRRTHQAKIILRSKSDAKPEAASKKEAEKEQNTEQ